jgi:hypothetical protein
MYVKEERHQCLALCTICTIDRAGDNFDEELRAFGFHGHKLEYFGVPEGLGSVEGSYQAESRQISGGGIR